AFENGTIGLEEVQRIAQKKAEGVTEVKELFTEWSTGKTGELYPKNVGKLVRAGSRVEFDIHYHAVGEEITGVLEVGWGLYPKNAPPKYNAEFMPMGAVNVMPTFEIPPNSIVQHQGAYTLPAPAILHNFQPHMHYRGKALLLEAVYPDGRREVLNYTDHFDNS